MAKVVIRIPRDPSAPRTITVDGVIGASCKDLTANLEKALGDVKSSELTPEYYLDPQEQQQQQLEG